VNRASYRRAVTWIALHDTSTPEILDSFSPAKVLHSPCVLLTAETFGMGAQLETIAGDVVKARRKLLPDLFKRYEYELARYVERTAGAPAEGPWWPGKVQP
jgi:hypothetical protein